MNDYFKAAFILAAYFLVAAFVYLLLVNFPMVGLGVIVAAGITGLYLLALSTVRSQRALKELLEKHNNQ